MYLSILTNVVKILFVLVTIKTENLSIRPAITSGPSPTVSKMNFSLKITKSLLLKIHYQKY